MMHSARHPHRPQVISSDHTVHRYEPASNRDSTPPVGAIMDVQMMYASHLFNSKSVLGNHVASSFSATAATPATAITATRTGTTSSFAATTLGAHPQPRQFSIPPDSQPTVETQSQNPDTEAYEDVPTEQTIADEDRTEDMNEQLTTDTYNGAVSAAPGKVTNPSMEISLDGCADHMSVIEEEDYSGELEDLNMVNDNEAAMRQNAVSGNAAGSRRSSKGEVRRTNTHRMHRDQRPEPSEDGMEDDDVEGSEDEPEPEEQDNYHEGEEEQEEEEEEESGEDEESDEEMATDPDVLEEMERFQEAFVGIEKRFRLINKIGEGTFSSVYKAEDLLYNRYVNDWDFDTFSSRPASRHHKQGGRQNGRPKYVAIKKIYVTSSPARIQNELELLHDLSGSPDVVPLITAFRHQDQVVAILPYFKHVDFRDYFRDLTVNDMRYYFRSLFSALSHVHKHGIIHRDIKPTNFLYDVQKRTGVLVDFGLAEREGTDSSYCVCSQPQVLDNVRAAASATPTSLGYPKNDPRPSRRANRAGTRGFRAPEVLFKCGNQTTKIDIWSAGVILLTILSKRFPFFNSSDDVDATIEIATIFGKAKMRSCAALHGSIFETSIPTIGEKGFTLEKIVLWATNRTGSGSGSNNKDDEALTVEESQAVKFMQECFELDPAKRISAEDALRHEFLREGATRKGVAELVDDVY